MGARTRASTVGRSSATLIVVLAALCVLALAMKLLLERPPAPPATAVAGASRAGDGDGTAQLRSAPPPPELVPARVPVQRGASAEVARAPAEAQPAGLVTGLLSIDGAVPEGGQVVLRTRDGRLERRAELDRFGRFTFEAVPVVEMSLSCEVAAPEGESTEWRRLLSPDVEVLAVAGGRRHMDLEWATKHVNVRVVSDDPAGNQARVEVEGPATSASFETDAMGKAKLSLVGSGSYRFRAVQSSGRSGEASVDLEEDVDLESVVIAASLPR